MLWIALLMYIFIAADLYFELYLKILRTLVHDLRIHGEKIYKRVPLLIQKTNSTSSMGARSKESTK